MNIKSGYILITVLIIIVTFILFSGCINEENSSGNTKVNEGIIRTEAFSVNSVSAGLNTSAEGTLFIRGAEGVPEHVQIIARIEIDPDDWGGVAFYIPDKWQISGIKSSYPEKETQAAPSDYITTLTTGDPDYEWKAIVEVGRDFGRAAGRGGSGTVVIDLIPDKDATDQPGTSGIMIAVGSDEKDGIKICGTDHIEVPISSTDNG